MTETSDNSFVVHDLQLTHSVRSDAAEPVQSEAWDLYLILHWAQRLRIDFLPVTHQKTMGDVGEGATAIVQQGYVNSRLEFAFKIADKLSRFRNEMIILAIHSVRTHPFIATIQGIGWDVEDESGDVRPALVFEKAAHGSLESFMQGEVGRSVGLAQRVAFCCQIALVMVDMENLRTWQGTNLQLVSMLDMDRSRADLPTGLTHNDIKPSNILVYEEPELDGAFVIRVTDFGCAEFVPTDSVADGYLVNIPESKPWTVPPPEYHHRGFSFSTAVKAMVYSFGVCCLWLLLYNQPGDTGDRFIQEFDMTKAPTMEEFAYLQLSRLTNWIPETLMDDIRQLFKLTLAAPATRASRMGNVLPVLQQAFQKLHSPVHESRPIITHKYDRYPGVKEELGYMHAGDHTGLRAKFNVSLAMLYLHSVDYRIRRKIFRCVEQCEALYHGSEAHARQRQQHCLDLAFCYLIGFGVEQDLTIHQHFLTESGAEDELAREIQLLRTTSTPVSLFLGWTAWAMNLTTSSNSYDLSYYFGRQALSDLRRIQKQELHDWSEVLGDGHFIVMQKYDWVVQIEKTYDLEGGLQLAQKAYQIASSFLPAASPDAFTAKTTLADVLIMKKQFKEAHNVVKAIMVNRPEPWEEGFSYRCDSLLADIYEQKGRGRKSDKLRRRALEKAGRMFGERHAIYAEMLLRLALFMKGRDATEAQRLFEQVLQLATESWGPDSAVALLAMSNIRPVLGPTWWYWGRSLPSHQFDREAIERHQAVYGNYHRQTIVAMETGVSLLLQKFRSVEALELMEHTARLAEIVYQESPDDLKYYRLTLRNVRITCWCFLKLEKIGLQKFLKYQVSVIPLAWSARLGPHHERIWGPLYKVKELWKTLEPYSFDPHKDPRHVGDSGHP